MTAKERKEKANFHLELIDLITKNTETDDDFFRRLIWANEMIAMALNHVLDKEEE